MGIVELLTAVAVFFGGGILVNALFNELLEWQPRFRNWCLRMIVRHLPEAERELRLEEWAAHMEECPGTFSKLFLLLNLWRASKRIAKDDQRRAAAAPRHLTRMESPQPIEYISSRREHLLSRLRQQTSEEFALLGEVQRFEEQASGTDKERASRIIEDIRRRLSQIELMRVELSADTTDERSER